MLAVVVIVVVNGCKNNYAVFVLCLDVFCESATLV